MMLYKFKSAASTLYPTDMTREIIHSMKIAAIAHGHPKRMSETVYFGLALRGHTLNQLKQHFSHPLLDIISMRNVLQGK